MSTTETLQRNHQTGLTDSSHSSSVTAERYRLDELDGRPILLYKYRGGLQTSSQKDLCTWLDKGESYNSHMGKEIARTIRHRKDRAEGNRSPMASQSGQSCRGLDLLLKPPVTPCFPPILLDVLTTRTDESLRVTKKAIPRMTSYVDVKRHDLYLPEEKELYSDFPNYDSNLASIKVPSLAYWSRMIFGSYAELYIVSPESSPSSSVADEDSRRTSPTSTWGREEEEAQLGDMESSGSK